MSSIVAKYSAFTYSFVCFLPASQNLTRAIEHTGSMYEDIGMMIDEQVCA